MIIVMAICCRPLLVIAVVARVVALTLAMPSWRSLVAMAGHYPRSPPHSDCSFLHCVLPSSSSSALFLLSFSSSASWSSSSFIVVVLLSRDCSLDLSLSRDGSSNTSL